MPPVDTRLLIPKSRLGDARDEMTADTAEGMSPDTVWGRRTTDAAIGSAINCAQVTEDEILRQATPISG